jgi:hypothetical protein
MRVIGADLFRGAEEEEGQVEGEGNRLQDYIMDEEVCTCRVFQYYQGGYKNVVYLGWPTALLVFESKFGVMGGGGGCGVSANEYSCAHQVTWSPNKLWRSISIFNLCLL